MSIIVLEAVSRLAVKALLTVTVAVVAVFVEYGSFAVNVKIQVPEIDGVNVTTLPEPAMGQDVPEVVYAYVNVPEPPDANAFTGIDCPTSIVTAEDGSTVNCNSGLTVTVLDVLHITFLVVALSMLLKL